MPSLLPPSSLSLSQEKKNQPRTGLSSRRAQEKIFKNRYEANITVDHIAVLFILPKMGISAPLPKTQALQGERVLRVVFTLSVMGKAL